MFWFWAFPLLVFAIGAITFPMWWPFVKKYGADHQKYYAALRERSALGRRRARNTWMVYIQPGPEDIEMVNALVADYEKLGEHSPVRIVVIRSRDALVEIGWWFNNLNTVAPWYLTADLKDAANDAYHTIPLKQQTTLFPIALSTEKRDALLAKVATARAGRGQLQADEVRKLMAMDPQNSTEGYEVEFALEADWQIVDPVKFLLGHEFVGDLMVSVFNNAARLGMAGIRLIPVDGSLDHAVTETVARDFEKRTAMYIGTHDWDEEYASAHDMAPIPEADEAKTLLKDKGVVLKRIRIRDIVLPERVNQLIQEPAAARAKATVDLTAANVKVEVSEKEAEALRLKGKGEKDYAVTLAQGRMESAKLDAQGDTARIEAWKSDDPAAVAARIAQIQATTFGEAVSKPGAGKVIITGTPGSSTPSAESLVASLSGVAATVASAVKPQDAGEKGKPKDEQTTDQKPPQPGNQSSSSSESEDDE